MANSLNQIVYDILEIYKGNQISDDSDIDERQVAFHVNTQRALIIREMLKNGGKIDFQLEQDLGCLELEEAEATECCDIDSDCYLIRTKLTIPKFIETDGGNGITRVGPVIKTALPFSFVPYHQAIYAGEGKYNGRMIFAFPLNNRIYIKSKEPSNLLVSHINVRGVLEDPSEASNYTTCGGGTSCYSNDDAYPIHGWMIPIIKQRILKEILPSLMIPKDTSNDAKDNIDATNKN